MKFVIVNDLDNLNRIAVAKEQFNNIIGSNIEKAEGGDSPAADLICDAFFGALVSHYEVALDDSGKCPIGGESAFMTGYLAHGNLRDLKERGLINLRIREAQVENSKNPYYLFGFALADKSYEVERVRDSAIENEGVTREDFDFFEEAIGDLQYSFESLFTNYDCIPEDIKEEMDRKSHDICHMVDVAYSNFGSDEIKVLRDKNTSFRAGRFGWKFSEDYNKRLYDLGEKVEGVWSGFMECFGEKKEVLIKDKNNYLTKLGNLKDVVFGNSDKIPLGRGVFYEKMIGDFS